MPRVGRLGQAGLLRREHRPVPDRERRRVRRGARGGDALEPIGAAARGPPNEARWAPGGRRPSHLRSAEVQGTTRRGARDRLQPQASPSRNPAHYLDYALGLPGRIAEADRKEVVVFFDEFQEIGGPHQPYGDPDRRDQADAMRSSSALTGVSYLFAGSLEHHDARPLHPVAPGPSPVRRLPRPAPDRLRGVASEGLERALRGRRLRGRADGP